MDGVGASVVLTDTGCELMVVPTLMLTPIWLLETPQTSAHRSDQPADGHYSGANRLLLDLRPDLGTDLRRQSVRQRHVVQVSSHGFAVLEGPVKEFQDFG